MKQLYKMGTEAILLENIIANSPQFIFWKNTDSIYLGCNENFASIAGLKRREDIVGKTDYELPWAKVADIYLNEDKAIIEAGKPLEQKEVPLITADNEEMIIIVSKRPLFDSKGHVIAILGIYMDITERKKNEALLKEAKVRAESADKAKTEFLMNMSHDIRTPVSGVIGVSEILEQQGSSEQDRNYGHLIHTSTEQLLQLLNDILDVISVESLQEDNIEIEIFDLRESIHRIEELLLPNLYLKDINFKICIDENFHHKIESDRIKIERILLNLLGNAIKFTSHGYIKINVKLIMTVNEQAYLELTISDSGIGIPENQIDKVFDRFFRATPSYEGVYEGHGIGLFLVKKFVTLLKGKINIQSQLDKGTIISVVLPVKIKTITDKEISTRDKIDVTQTISELKFQKIQEEQLFPAPKSLPSTPQRPRVLLIEDDNIARLTAQNFFHQAECEIETAVNAESAIKMAKTTPFDLIMTDIGLPGMSGNEFAVLFRYWEKAMGKSPLPIIGLSAHISAKTREESLLANMNDIIAKPLNEKKAKDILARYKIGAIFPQSKNKDLQTSLSSDLSGMDELSQLELVPLFDEKEGIANAGNSKEMLIELLNILVRETLPNELTNLKEAHARQDWSLIRDLAHKLKGGALYCGTTRICEACHHLEKYFLTEDYALLEKLYQQLIRILEETRQYINLWLLSHH